jgi:hypothetical protein
MLTVEAKTFHLREALASILLSGVPVTPLVSARNHWSPGKEKNCNG